jgi:hypothetical protein
LLRDPQAPLCGRQEHHAAIGSDASTIERSRDFLASDGWKTEALNCIIVLAGVARSDQVNGSVSTPNP